MAADFGEHVRKKREQKRGKDARYSLRQLAGRVGVEPSYLSKVERGQEAPPSESTILALAKELDEDPDVLLAMAGKLSTDLRNIILKRPKLFAQLIREMKNLPNHAVLRVVREVRDGNW